MTRIAISRYRDIARESVTLVTPRCNYFARDTARPAHRRRCRSVIPSVCTRSVYVLLRFTAASGSSSSPLDSPRRKRIFLQRIPVVVLVILAPAPVCEVRTAIFHALHELARAPRPLRTIEATLRRPERHRERERPRNPQNPRNCRDLYYPPTGMCFHSADGCY